MRCFILIVLSLPVIACGIVDDLLNALTGNKYEVVILAKGPVMLDKKPLTLRPDRPMKVIGELSSVCLVLKDNVEQGPANTIDKLFETAMDGATVNITVELTSGGTLKFFEPMQSWRREGRVLESNELSGCSSACCKDQKKLTKGIEVKEVQIVSTKPLKVRGIFWESTNAFDGLGK